MAIINAKSILTFYSISDITKEKNILIEDITEFLNTFDDSYKMAIDNFQLIKHDLKLEIKLNKSQVFYNTFIYNFLTIQNIYINEDETTTNDNIYYYFVDYIKPIAPDTIKIFLSLDTINSIGGKDGEYTSDLHPLNFGDKTEITAQHKERFNLDVWQYTDTLNHVHKFIDGYPENINASLEKIEDKIILSTEETQDGADVLEWYLIINSNLSGTNPVNAYLCANKQLTIIHNTQNSTPAKLTGLRLNNYTYFVNTDNMGEFKTILKGKKGNSINTPIKTILDGNQTYNIKLDGTLYSGVSIEAFIFHRFLINIPYFNKVLSQYNIVLEILFTSNGVKYHGYFTHLYENTITLYSSFIDLYITQNLIFESAELYGAKYRTGTTTANYNKSTMLTYTATAISTTTEEININGFDSLDNQIETLQKIIILPYCPINIEFNPTTKKYYIGDGFEVETSGDLTGFLKFTPFITNERTNINIIDLENYLISDLHLEHKEQAKNNKFESKLFNSELFYLKLYVDTFNLTIKPENVKLKRQNQYTPPIYTINYYVSNELTSEYLYKIEPYNNGSELIQHENYQNILLINRSNEMPIYNNVYLNYVKTGYNFDEKSKQYNNIINATNLISNSVKGGTLGAIMGAGNLLINDLQTKNKNDKHLVELQRQNIGVVGNTNNKLFMFYNDGVKLHYSRWQAPNYIINAAANQFYYYGYKCHDIGTPDTTTRKLFNYLQCKPDFNVIGKLKYNNDFVNDLYIKYNNGVVVLHKYTINGVNKWNIAQDKENWETRLFNYLS